MKILRILLIIVFAAAFSAAIAETYPIYEVIVRPALMTETPDNPGNTVIITTPPMGAQVLVCGAVGDWSLVATRDGIVGYMATNTLKDTGEKYEFDGVITEADITKRAELTIKYITVDAQAMLPDAAAREREYPAVMIRGEQDIDLPHLLGALLGEGYEQMPRDADDYVTKYESRAEDKPYRNIRIYDLAAYSHFFSYRDAMVTGERGGEYEPPDINMMPEESIIYAKSLLNGVVPDEWLENPGVVRVITERWGYAERWLTEAEFADYMKNKDAHYIVFEHHTSDGVSILDDSLLCAVGVNGLSMLSINRHKFSTGEGHIAPMPLEDAIAMANTTRSSPTVLLYSQLVYSNWLTEDENYNLSWYLVTSKGSYVVDCVLSAHKCDSYEY